MFSVTGRLEKIFETPAGKGKDGQAYEATVKAQIMGEIVLKNGETKLELLTLTIPPRMVAEAKSCLKTDVTWPCGLFVSGGKITAFLPA